MTSVNPDQTSAAALPFLPRDEDRHAALLMGLLFRRLGEGVHEEDWGGLRQSHMRVVTAVPPEGVSVTDLAERVGMTKQGCGQFVTQLAGTGHLRVDPQPGDRRVRLVRRTPSGEAFVRAVNRRVAGIEAGWAERVGQERYAGFRAVLEELALGPDPGG